MGRTAYEVQRDFALTSSLHCEIIWDTLAPDQAEVLKLKIANLIFQSTAKHTKIVARQRQQVFDNVWQQRKYSNRILLSAIVYVLVTNERDPELALKSTDFSCHPVIRTRKCLAEDTGNSDGCCMIFIDEHGRVYDNWRQYVYKNTLPKGTMIAPSQGIYRLATDEDNVHLMVHLTPATRANHKLLHTGDNMATLGGLVATVPVAAALVSPVAPPVLLAATVVGITSAAYSTVRSVNNLYDRHQHKQSTSLLDSEARGSWLGIASGVVGLGATGAVKALNVAGAEVGAITQLAVKGINVSSIVLSGTGVANGVYDLYLKISNDQPLSSIDVLQIASSLVILTHSINNFRLANRVTNGPSDFRDAVRNQTRKVFGEIAQESVKLNGDSSTNIDIMRTLNDIPIKEVLLSMHEIYTHLSQGASVLGAVGATLLSRLMSLDFAGQTRLLGSQFGSKFVKHISSLDSLLDVIDAVATYFTEEALQLLMQFTRSFLEHNVDDIDRALNTYLTTEALLYRILMQCVRNYKEFTVEFLENRRGEILSAVSNYFESLQTINTQTNRKFKCTSCHGVYYLINSTSCL